MKGKGRTMINFWSIAQTKEFSVEIGFRGFPAQSLL